MLYIRRQVSQLFPCIYSPTGLMSGIKATGIYPPGFGCQASFQLSLAPDWWNRMSVYAAERQSHITLQFQMWLIKEYRSQRS